MSFTVNETVRNLIEQADEQLNKKRPVLQAWMQKPFYAKRDSDKEVEDMFKALDQELDDMKKAARGVVPQGDTDWKYLEDAVLETKKRNLRYKNVFKEYNAFRSKVVQNVGWAQSNDAKCACGGLYKNIDNGAHILSDHLIRTDQLILWPAKCVCCPAGRPIKPFEVGNYVFSDEVKLPEGFEVEGDLLIYCEHPKDKQKAHVYFGTADKCAQGDGRTAKQLGFTKIRYYQSINSRPAWKWPDEI